MHFFRPYIRQTLNLLGGRYLGHIHLFFFKVEVLLPFFKLKGTSPLSKQVLTSYTYCLIQFLYHSTVDTIGALRIPSGGAFVFQIGGNLELVLEQASFRYMRISI